MVPGGVTKVTPVVSQPKLAAATKLLNLLEHLTGEEPPAGLALRTMKFIDQTESQRIGTAMTAAESPGARAH
jgi:hypothetical protein